MELDNLKENMTIKNYIELCKILDIAVKTGRARQNQLKWFEEYFKYHKKGNLFIIDKVFYDKEIKPMRKRGGANNTTPYLDLIEKLILDLLVQDENKGKVFLSKNKLFKALEMINDNYDFCKQKIPKLSRFMDINELNIREWYNCTDDMLERNINSALKNLENQFLIKWSKEITVCEVKPLNGKISVRKEIRHDIYNEEIVEYKINGNTSKIYREATDEEKRFILKTERNVMLDLECKNKQEIIYKKLWVQFGDKVNEIVLKKYNIAFYYQSYKILCNEEHIYERWSEMQGLMLYKIEKSRNKDILNKSIIERIYENACKRKNKAEKKREYFGDTYDDLLRDEDIDRRIDEKYLKDINNLNNKLLNKNSKDIKNLVIEVDKNKK